MRRTAIVVHLALIGVFGVFLPWWKGVDFLDPVMLSAYACLAILFAAPAAVEAFSAGRPESFEGALARIAMAVIYAESMTIAILAAALITVYSRTRFLLPPDLETLGMALVFGIAASAALAAIAGWMTLRFSAGAARGALRLVFLGLLLLFFLRSRWLPDVAGAGTLASVIVAGGAMFGMKRSLGRGSLPS